MSQEDSVGEKRIHEVHLPVKKSFWQEMKPYSGIYPTRVSFLNLLLRPFLACFTPVCLWASLLYGVAITWLVLIATSVAQIFSAPRESVQLSLCYSAHYLYSYRSLFFWPKWHRSDLQYANNTRISSHGSYKFLVSPFVGSLLAALMCGPLTDFAARTMSRMNQGKATRADDPHIVNLS